MSPPRVALVTGASAGIGKAITRRLLSDGWTVYGAARRVEKMADLESEGARTVFLDLLDDESMRACVDTVLGAEGRIDALVNNAGYGSYGAIEEVEIDEARRQFEVNLFGLARLTQLVIPAMRRQKSGRIVNISSMGGRIWMPIGGWYHATKHALEVLSDALRLEVRPFGIDVVVVQPGPIQSEWSDVAADTLDETVEGTHYRRLVEPMAAILRNYDNAASPEVVARAVSKALASRKPRRRYTVPLYAKLLVFLHGVLPAWAWERLMLYALRGR